MKSLFQITIIILILSIASAFVPHFPTRGVVRKIAADTRIFSVVEDPTSMKASELRKELQSYGISTASFFEKSELVEAVEKARKEGKKPINADVNESTGTESRTDSSGASREQRIAEEKLKCDKMKVGELKKELESLGISTKSFFEKTEFVQALAEARIDGVKKNSRSGRKASAEEPYDPSYRDVVMKKMTDPRALASGGKVIDIRLK